MEFIQLNPNTAFDEAIKALNSNPKLVVCGANDEIDSLKEMLEFSEQNTDGIIQASKEINIQQWLQDRKSEFAENDSEWDSEFNDEMDAEWETDSPGALSFTLDKDILTGEPVTNLVGVQIPAEESWHLPAHFKYGGWNECPIPEIQCAIWHYWEAKYGAKIVGISHDVIEAYVANPPTTLEEAKQLANEQYLYCTDIVDQGVQSVANLAALLLNQKIWYFWWD